MFLGSKLCENENDTRVWVGISLAESTFTEIDEVEAYPLLELVNELMGFAGMCFGISLLWFGSLFQTMDARIPRKNPSIQLQLALLEFVE